MRVTVQLMRELLAKREARTKAYKLKHSQACKRFHKANPRKRYCAKRGL